VKSILVVSEFFWPEGGGAELATYLILKLLAQHNFKITVITGTNNPARIPGVRYYIRPYLKASNRITRWTLMKMTLANELLKDFFNEHDILYIPLYAYPLIPLAKKKGLYVIVHLHNYAPIRYSSLKYFFEPRAIRIWEEFKNSVFHEYHVQNSIIRTLLCPASFVMYLISKRWVLSADKIICVSKRQAQIIIKQEPKLRDKVEIIYNPLPRKIIHSEPRKTLDDVPTFLYIGGDSYVKGFLILLQTLKDLGKSNIKARFILANNYSKNSLMYLGMLSEKYRNIGIKVVGRVEHSKLLELHETSWALFFPSISEEPLPYAVVESIALKTIPIAPKIGGIPEIIEGTPAEEFLFKPGDINDIISKLDKLALMSKADIINLGTKSREHIIRLLSKEEHRLIELFKYI